jgi:signal transduction histidine kinase
MKEQNVLRIIIPLLLLSLLGLVALQVQLLKNVYDQKELAFDRSALNALHAVARALETREVQTKVLRMMGEFPRGKKVVMTSTPDSIRGNYSHAGGSTSFRFEFHSPPPPTADSLFISNDTMTMKRRMAPPPQMITTIVSDSVVDRRSGKPVMHERHVSASASSSGEMDDGFWYLAQQFEEFGGPAHLEKMSPSRRQELMTQAFDYVYVNSGKPLEHTVTKSLLDSLIRSNLEETGIDLPYAFAIASEGDDSLRLVSTAAYYSDLHASKLAAGLFTGDLMGSVNRLLIFFPGRNLFILRQMAPSLAAATVFVLIILGSFAYTVGTIYRQKRFHSLLRDFINNMTHEFKTPISTISIITDTLTLPNVIAEKEKVAHYNRIIQDEIGRMKGHVEKILQMAVLEEGDYELKLSDVDVHALISDAAEKIRIRVEARGGVLRTELGAARHVVPCDAFHFSNIIFNLLDNAEKYSPERPVIDVTTCEARGGISISVRDEGIGIPEKDQKHVFDRYYRVSTGNRHDVKGFGLGLSYVKLMVEAQGGTIGLKSSPGKGTTVTLQFPLSA